MIAVPIALILKGLKATKGKNGAQIEVEAKAHEMLAAFATLTESKQITLPELEKLMEDAGLEIALQKMAEKMRPQLNNHLLHVLR